MLIILKVVLQVVTVASAILTSILDYKWHDKRTAKFKTSRNILYFTTGTLLLLSIGVTVFDDIENNKKEQKLSSDLKKVQDQNDGLQKGIEVLSGKSSNILQEQRDSFLSVLRDQRTIGLDTASRIDYSANFLQTGIERGITKQNALQQQQATTLNNLMGGDSFCYLSPAFVDADSVMLVLSHNGEFPLYDVVVEMTDKDVMKTLNQQIDQQNLHGLPVWDLINRNKASFEQRTSSPNSGKFLGTVSLKGITQKRLHMNIWTRYRMFSEEMKIVRTNEGWIFALRVTETPQRGKEGQRPQEKVLLFQQSKNFPLNAKGEVEW